MNRDTQDQQRLDAAIRTSLSAAPDLSPMLVSETARRAHAAQRRPGEGSLSIRGAAYFSETTGVAAIVLFAGLFYAVVEALQIASVFGG